MRKSLRPFQKIGVDFLAARFHALLADEMGLGKTLTALAAVERKQFKRVAVICPASVRENWKQEAEECGIPLSSLVVGSYNAAADSKFPPGPYDCAILDEAHFLKTPDSKRTQAVFGNKYGLVRSCKYIWPLTGTPVLNRPRELYPILKTLHGKEMAPYDNWTRFTQRYCAAFFDGRGINTKGASHLDELSAKLRGFMLRRTKDEVMPELPPKVFAYPPLELNSAEKNLIYDVEAEIQNREAYLSPTMEDYSQLGDLARLWKVTGVAKIRAVSEFVSDMLETVDKVVVFARHREVIEGLSKKLNGSVTYHGGMNDKQKKAAVSRFVEDKKVNVFIGQIQAAGTGINGLQTVCNNVVFSELSWVPGEMLQATDRCHRIGQTGACVSVYFLHVPGSLESAMLKSKAAKTAIIERLVERKIDLLEGLK